MCFLMVIFKIKKMSNNLTDNIRAIYFLAALLASKTFLFPFWTNLRLRKYFGSI